MEKLVREKDEQPINCSIHPAKKCYLYCETCSDVMCVICLGHHSEHKVDDIDSVMSPTKKVQQSSDYVKECKNYLEEIERFLENISKLKQQFSKALEKCKIEVQNQVKQKIAEVIDGMVRTIEEISEIEKEGEGIFDANTNSLATMKEDVKRLLEESSHVVQIKGNRDFLQKYKALNKKQFNNSGLSFIKFKPNKSDGDISLGKLLTKEEEEVEKMEEDAEKDNLALEGKSSQESMETTYSQGSSMSCD